MKTAFYAWLTDDFKNTIIDFDNFEKSFKHFHSDIDLVVFDTADIKKLFSEKPWLNHCNCKASFAKLLYNDYDLVVNVDADFYFFDRLTELLEVDYDIAACANFNVINNNVDIAGGELNGLPIPTVDHPVYIQGGLIASPSKKFWDQYEEYSRILSDDMRIKENDVLNVIWHGGYGYNTKVLDGSTDFKSPDFKQYYNCASLGREAQAVIKDGKVHLDDKVMRSYHVAHGNNGPQGIRKHRLNELFRPEVVNWFNSTVNKN
jgi:hypothetical protein